MANNNEEENDNFSRPQTVSLNQLRQEYKSNNETESDVSIGEAFFPQPKNEIAKENSPKQTETKPDDPDLTELTPEEQTQGLPDNQADPVKNTANTGNGSPYQRPKTVTIKSTNQRKQRLLNMGAVSGQDVVVIDSDAVQCDQPQQINSALSPKPKSDQCYICGKAFLLSSIKVHEKQCSKKFQREEEKRDSQESARGDNKVSSSVEKTETKSNGSKNSPSTNSQVSKLPKKLELEACYLCGRKFFVHSLGIHETQCIKNWKATKTPDAKHRSLSERALDDYDEIMVSGVENFHEQLKVEVKKEKLASKNQASNAETMGSPKCEKIVTEARSVGREKTVPCYMCGVQLFPHSLEVHEKKCRSRNESEGNGGDEGGVKNETLESPKKRIVTEARSVGRQKTVPCYMCGVQLFPHSLEVHEKKCRSRNNSEDNGGDEGGVKNETLESPKKKIGSEARSVGRQKTVPCYLCGMQLFPHSLKVHEKKCRSRNESEGNGGVEGLKSDTVESPKRKIGSEASSVGRQKGLKTVPCYLCGAQLFPHSLKVHEKKCRSRNESEGNGGEEGLKSDTVESPKKKIDSEASSVGRQKGLKTVPCYLCGAQLFPHSLKIHEKKCRSRNESEGNGGEEGLKSSSEPAVEDDLVSDLVTGATNIALESAEDKQEEQTLDESFLDKTKEIEDKNPSGPSSSRISKKPRTVICYICGQEFLKSSLAVHEKQCASKNKAKTEQVESKSTNDKKAFATGTQTRKPKPDADSPRVSTPPRKPKTQKCFICGKEMLLSSLAIHEQQCQKKSTILKNINQPKGQQKPRSPRQVGRKPKTAVCYICGEHFLSSSIKVHETQCEKKWNANKT